MPPPFSTSSCVRVTISVWRSSARSGSSISRISYSFTFPRSPSLGLSRPRVPALPGTVQHNARREVRGRVASGRNAPFPRLARPGHGVRWLFWRWRLRRRRPAPAAPDPAEELKRKLAESRSAEPPPEPEAEPVEPPEPPLDERRRAVHDRARADNGRDARRREAARRGVGLESADGGREREQEVLRPPARRRA